MLTDVLALLCWTYQPLTEAVLRAVLHPLYAYTADWEQTLTDALRCGHIMLRRAEIGQGSLGWTLYHDSFRQHLRHTPTLRTARERAHHLLLDWCSHWQDHKSPYALRYYPQHLLAIQRYDALYALARSDIFLQAQEDILTDEPEATLHTLRAALGAAIVQDDAAMIAECCLAHARRLVAITQESPLDALRAGNLKRAWALADLFSMERWVLWHLLLAWELRDQGRRKEAQATLERLQTRHLSRLPEPQGIYAACLLRHIADLNWDAFNTLAEQMVDSTNRAILGGGEEQLPAPLVSRRTARKTRESP